MASENGNTFQPRLFDGDDNAEDLAYKNVINELITQHATAAVAAANIDAWVVEQANTKYEQLKQRNPPFCLTAEERDSVYLVGPNPSRHISMIFDSIATVCSAYPPHHPAQNSLIEFVQELKALPKHEVPDLSYKEDTDEPTFENNLTLWEFGTPSVDHLAQKFQRQAEDIAYPFSDVERPGHEFRFRWQNLQGFISRLTTLGLIDCSIASAVPYLLPSHHAYPNLENREKHGHERIVGDLSAAAQWLEPEDARRWVHSQCQSAGEGDGTPSQIWNLTNWRKLKEQMAFIEADERFSQETQTLARQLREKMDAQENA